MSPLRIPRAICSIMAVRHRSVLDLSCSMCASLNSEPSLALGNTCTGLAHNQQADSTAVWSTGHCLAAQRTQAHFLLTRPQAPLCASLMQAQEPPKCREPDCCEQTRRESSCFHSHSLTSGTGAGTGARLCLCTAGRSLLGKDSRLDPRLPSPS